MPNHTPINYICYRYKMNSIRSKYRTLSIRHKIASIFGITTGILNIGTYLYIDTFGTSRELTALGIMLSICKGVLYYKAYPIFMTTTGMRIIYSVLTKNPMWMSWYLIPGSSVLSKDTYLEKYSLLNMFQKE